jgi:hypothetical protein
LRAYKLPGRVQGSNLIPLFSEQEYVSRRNGVAYLPQKPEQYSIAARENLVKYYHTVSSVLVNTQVYLQLELSGFLSPVSFDGPKSFQK